MLQFWKYEIVPISLLFAIHVTVLYLPDIVKRDPE